MLRGGSQTPGLPVAVDPGRRLRGASRGHGRRSTSPPFAPPAAVFCRPAGQGPRRDRPADRGGPGRHEDRGHRPGRRRRRSWCAAGWPTPREDYAGHPGRHRPSRGGRGAPRRGSEAPVGVGMPGTISPATGRVKNANSTWLNGRPLHEDLERRLGRAGAPGQRRQLLRAVRGAGRRGGGRAGGLRRDPGHGHRAAGSWSTATSSTGPNAMAGEWGHNPLPWPSAEEWPGPPCYCGRTGCVELFLSGPGLAREHQLRDRARRGEAAEIARRPRGATRRAGAPSRPTRTGWPAAWPWS